MSRYHRYIVLALLLLTSAGLWTNWQQEQRTAHNLIRLHVIAHSNNFYDQKLKHQVKDRIVAATAADFQNAQDIEEARVLTDTLTEKIKQVAETAIAEQGFDYSVQVVRGNFHFPAKTYTGKDQTATVGAAFTLPAGKYEAVRVIIGQGQGSNWWCVLYPPLCFVGPQETLPPLAAPVATAGAKKKTATNEIKSNTREPNPTPRIEYRLRIVDFFKSHQKSNKTTTSH